MIMNTAAAVVGLQQQLTVRLLRTMNIQRVGRFTCCEKYTWYLVPVFGGDTLMVTGHFLPPALSL